MNEATTMRAFDAKQFPLVTNVFADCARRRFNSLLIIKNDQRDVAALRIDRDVELVASQIRTHINLAV